MVEAVLGGYGAFRADQITTLAMPASVPVLDPAQYSCIAVWTNNELPPPLAASHMVAYGDALKRYVDDGGGVILMQGAFFPDEYDRIRMRVASSADGYMPLDPVGPPAASETHTLDFSSALTSHPILSGCERFPWGRSGNYFAGAALDPGAKLVGRDNRGVPTIAVSQSGRVAALNVYPGHVDPVPSIHKSPVCNRAIANACVAVSSGSGTPTATSPGTNVTVEPVIVDATGVATTPVAITFDNLTSAGRQRRPRPPRRSSAHGRLQALAGHVL